MKSHGSQVKDHSLSQGECEFRTITEETLYNSGLIGLLYWAS